jgi:hypothetical protein
LESEHFGKKDFYRMDDYVLRLKPEATRKLIDALRIKFNSTVRHAGKLYTWDTLIRLKAQELANYILARRIELDFEKPRPNLRRSDSEAVRNQILSMTSAEARGLGIRRSTFWYLQQRTRTGKPLKTYRKITSRLAEPSQAASFGSQ